MRLTEKGVPRAITQAWRERDVYGPSPLRHGAGGLVLQLGQIDDVYYGLTEGAVTRVVIVHYSELCMRVLHVDSLSLVVTLLITSL